jgi:Bacterial Ig-like domain
MRTMQAKANLFRTLLLLLAVLLVASAPASAQEGGYLYPHDQETGVHRDTNVYMYFEAALDPTTVNTDTFKLVKQGTTTTPVTATVTYDNGCEQYSYYYYYYYYCAAVLDPQADLEAGSTYTATLKGGENGVKWASYYGGTPTMSEDYSWSFATSDDIQAPSPPTITSPQNNTSVSEGPFSVSGSAEAASTVELFEGTTSKGTTKADSSSSGAWSIALSGVSAGAHTYSAKATDAAGNTSSASDSLTVTVDKTAPIAKAPAHSLSATSSLGTSTTGNSVPVKLTWSATDSTGGSGIASYQLQQSINSGAYTNVTLPSATTTTFSPSLTPTKTYRFRVAAEDTAGNVSAWSYGPSFKVTAYAESSPSIVDTGTWTTSALSGAYGGSVQYASALGRNATFTVPAGTKNVEWVSTKASDRGKAQVWLDGIEQDADPGLTGTQPFELYSSSTQLRRAVFSKAVDSATTHKLEVRVLGQKNTSSTGTRVDIDAFVTTS